MAKLLDKFTKPFRDSRIPFLLLEIITNGQGTMVDLVCRFANSAAAALLDLTAQELQGQRFTRDFPSGSLTALRPLADVAFSGSSVSFSVTTLLGRTLDITAYQPIYGTAACILELHGAAPANALLTGSLPCPAAVVELSRAGARCLSLNQDLCALTGRPRRALLDAAVRDFSVLVLPEDWPPLLQDLLDAARDRRPVDRELRLRREDGVRWVDLRATLLGTQEGIATFHILFLDIGRQRRDTARLEARARELEQAQTRMDRLLDQLPGGRCLFRLEKGASPVPLLVTQGLAGMLGYPLSELKRRLAADPLWRVPAADREPLTAAALQARMDGTPLLHTCRMRPRGGGSLLVSLEAVWQPLDNGGWLLYAVCTDVTAARRASADLEVRAQLCDLMLDRSGSAAMVYDPAADTLRLQRYETDGHRTFRMISSCLAIPEALDGIHPEDWKKLTASLKRSVRSGNRESLEFRGDPDGQGWRWYRLTWAPLSEDADGRLLGKAEDITLLKSAQTRFQALTARQKKLAPGTLASARLDLDSDRILDAKGANRHLERVLFGNTADACLRHLRDNIPGEEDRAAFDSLFRRDVLLETYRQGESRLTLQHVFSPDGGAPVQAETTLELTMDPLTAHITAFCAVRAADGKTPEKAPR